MISFQKKYFILTLLLFIIEVLIAAFINDRFVRPYVGDFLVVMLMYCFIKSFLDAPVLMVAIPVLLFAYAIETLQYFDLVDRLGLQQSRLANIVIGNSFAWIDILAYTMGIAAVIWIESLRPVKGIEQATSHAP